METELGAELVIVSYRRNDILEATLQSIRRLYPDLPVCLGLQGEDAEALAVALQSSFAVRTVCLPAPSVTESLNRCILSSSADLVLMLDDDAIPCPGWLEAHLASFKTDPDLAYNSGREVRLRGGRSVGSELVRIPVESLLRLMVPKEACLLYTSPSPRDQRGSRMPSSA